MGLVLARQARARTVPRTDSTHSLPDFLGLHRRIRCVGLEDDLRDAVAVAEVDENLVGDAAVGVHPAVERDGLVAMLRAMLRSDGFAASLPCSNSLELSGHLWIRGQIDGAGSQQKIIGIEVKSARKPVVHVCNVHVSGLCTLQTGTTSIWSLRTGMNLDLLRLDDAGAGADDTVELTRTDAADAPDDHAHARLVAGCHGLNFLPLESLQARRQFQREELSTDWMLDVSGDR